jgi:signal transduction histidine kinase
MLVLLGTSVYVALERTLMAEVDRNLVSRSDQALPVLFPPQRRSDDFAQGGPGGSGGGPGANRRPTEGYSGGIFFLGLAPDHSIRANPQQVAVPDLPWPDTRDATFATVELADGDQARVLLRRTPDGGMLVTGESLDPEQTALRSLLFVLVGGGGAGLLLAVGAAWFLSGRALIPIQQAFKRQQEFVADASHELRTPLTVLRSATDLLNTHREEPLESNGELFDDVRAEIARMQRLAQDLLTLARSDVGGVELMTAPIQMADVAGEVVRRTRPLARSHDLELTLQAEPHEGTVEADPDRLQQVLLILLDNAIKHTPPGGRIDVRVRRRGQCAQVEVADTGTGIAPEHLPRIFDRFYRADKARARARGGTGLGLSIAKMLVEAHGGQLHLASTLGVGTQVTVTLPLAEHRATSFGERLGQLAAHLPHPAARQ